MTPFNVCPACVRVNLPDADVCTTCGAALRGAVRPGAEDDSATFVDLTEMELDADTTPSVHLDAPELQRWFNSRTGALDGRTEPTLPAETPEPETPLPALTLREVEAPPPSSDDDVATANQLPPGVILADLQTPLLSVPPEHPPAARAAPPARRSAAPLSVPRNPAPVATKALRRAQVRRSLQANKGQPDATTAPADVLVLEGDDAAREQLCALLEAFGFRTHPVQSTMQAVRMLAAKRYAAAFLSIVFDGSAAPASQDLCARVKAPPTHASDTVCVLIVITGSARPLERVRAELAGCDAILLKPVSRGAVAQALEACGVTLPIDARRV